MRGNPKANTIKKQQALEKQKKYLKRKIVDEETDDEEWKSDGSSNNFEHEVHPSGFEEFDEIPVEGDYVLTEFATENSKPKKFII
ncbi:unnamed protein product [Acanthoscelides obtectus]|uniref:Uncharacterized protein n=1 Tax=Acanthoscelides obtectus TaxID=200917 RepID=A0A9P0KM52_ACAOB|nr:unnamed protein product [Acanthoscelides obtectus]CAK1641908.1 hypothetical protein AOBTE_LOCUS12715 [Acanthoscelides obtectus]